MSDLLLPPDTPTHDVGRWPGRCIDSMAVGDPTLQLLVMPTYQQAEKVQQSPGQLGLFGT